MKNLSINSIIIWLALIAILSPGCNKETDLISTADIGYEGFKSDTELFYEFVYRKESLILNALNYTSDGFTKAPFEGIVSRDEFGKFFLELEDMNKNAEKYLQAIQKLEQSGVLQRPTQTRGLFSSAKDFITWMSGSGKRNRERITTIASNMSSQERNKLYNGLRKEWKDKASGEADFWNKLQKGDYDSSAGQIYNDFYHNADTEFPDLAQEKGLTPQKIVVNEGAKGIETGANVALDGAATLIPGFGTGVTIIKVSDNVEKMSKSETWKEAAEHGFHAVTDILEEAGGNIGYTAFNASDVVTAIKNKVDDLVFKKDDSHETNGKVTVKDKNPESQRSIVIAQKKGGGDNSDGSPSIYVIGKEIVSGGIDLLTKAGTWLVTVVNNNGYRETVEIKVEAGKITVAEVNTQEPIEENKSSNYEFIYQFEKIILDIDYFDDEGDLKSIRIIHGESLDDYVALQFKDGYYTATMDDLFDGKSEFKIQFDLKNETLKLAELTNKCNKYKIENLPSTTWTANQMVFEKSGGALPLYFNVENVGKFGPVSEGGCNRVVGVSFQSDSKVKIVIRKKK